jgi:hypothetical protein
MMEDEFDTNGVRKVNTIGTLSDKEQHLSEQAKFPGALMLGETNNNGRNPKRRNQHPTGNGTQA